MRWGRSKGSPFERHCYEFPGFRVSVARKREIPIVGQELFQPSLVGGLDEKRTAPEVLVPGMQVRESPSCRASFSVTDFPFFPCNDRLCQLAILGSIFSAPPGALFTERNIANQFQPDDSSTISFLSYGVQTLGVGDIIVMGRYGCGGVQAVPCCPNIMRPKISRTVRFRVGLARFVILT